MPQRKQPRRLRLRHRLIVRDLRRTDHFHAVLTGALTAVAAVIQQHDPAVATGRSAWSRARIVAMTGRAMELWQRATLAIQAPSADGLRRVYQEIEDLWNDVHQDPRYASVTAIIGILRDGSPPTS